MENTKLWIKNLFGWVFLNPQISLVVGAVLVGGIILLFIFGGVSSCLSGWTEEKKDNLNTNIKTAEIESNVLTNQKINANGVVINANQNSNAALAEVKKPRDSANYNSNFDDAMRQWCIDIDFQDSACGKYK